MTVRSAESRELERQLSETSALLDTLGLKDDISPDLISRNVGHVDWITSVESGTEVLLDTLYRLHKASFELQQKEPTYLSISLIDLKIIHRLLSTIIVACVYPALPPDVGIPLEQRLKSKNTSHNYSRKLNPCILRKVIDVFFKIMTVDGDISNLLISSQYSSDVFCAVSTLSFDPSVAEYHKEYRRLLTQFNDKIETYQLFEMLTNLLNTCRAPWMKAVASRTLAMIPLARRDNGVRSMIDFITGIRRSPEVSSDEVDRACFVLANVPKGIDAERYYSTVGRQLVEIMSAEKFDILVKTTSRIVSRLHSLRSDLAWRYVIGPINESISPSASRKETRYSGHQVDITVICISRLIPFISDTTKLELLKPASVWLLWTLALVRKFRKRPIQAIISLLASYFAMGDPITTDMLCRIGDGLGSVNKPANWRPYNSDDGDVGIEYLNNDNATNEEQQMSLENIEARLQVFIDLLTQIKGNDKLRNQIFLHEIRHWLCRSNNDESSPFRMFAGLRLLETIFEKFRNDLVKSSTEMLLMVEGVVSDYASGLEALQARKGSNKVTMDDLESITENMTLQDDSDDEDYQDSSETQIVSLAFSLMKAILHDPGELPPKDKALISDMTENLHLIALKASGQVSKDAQSVIELLKYFDGPGGTLSDPERIASRDKLKLALQNLDDPSAPVRAYGMHLLTLLVEKKDPIVDTTQFAGLFASQLANEDSYVYLNAIKGLKAMSDAYGSPAVEYLLTLYGDDNIDVEVRLRVGEALVGTIERLGQLLVGHTAKRIVETCLTCANRHGVTEDVRIRTSALSILGKACETNSSEIGRYASDCLDCAIGVLKMENGPEFVPIHRASLVLIASVLNNGEMYISDDIRQGLYRTLRYRLDTDEDELVKTQAQQVLDLLGNTLQDQLQDKLPMLKIVSE